ncbi:hypothetical protein FJ970_24420 [Mesorhizobium sp. B2-1-8]|uniref:hypothetical protein n=1 Tax=Mesorhizobium sp. B2-1-8 TaxID=2589967 RepID=UPI00112D0A7B|nr:hypothetical protein [Mesorhizobium sp. B2-1-8]UCI18213.1 hypothetical protein FJ970_24420 [Mesorhizobium sp. B2-1-8]
MIESVRDKIFVPWRRYAGHASSRSCRHPATTEPTGFGHEGVMGSHMQGAAAGDGKPAAAEEERDD